MKLLKLLMVSACLITCSLQSMERTKYYDLIRAIRGLHHHWTILTAEVDAIDKALESYETDYKEYNRLFERRQVLTSQLRGLIMHQTILHNESLAHCYAHNQMPHSFFDQDYLTKTRALPENQLTLR